MRTLSIEMGTAEKARDLWTALASFNAELTEQPPETYVVRVDLSRAGTDITRLLNAIREYVVNAQAGFAMIDLDGKTYMLETP